MLRDVEELRAGAIACADTALWALTDTEIVNSLQAVHHTEQALRAAKAHLVQQAGAREIAHRAASTSTASWLRWQLRVSIQEANRLVTLGACLIARPDLDRALIAGTINHEQALTVAKTLSELAGEVDDEIIAKAEARLIADAADLDPRQLRQAGSRILTHIAPEVAERTELAALERADARAHRNRYLTLSPIGDGGFRLHGTFDAEAAAVIRAALDPLCSPRAGRPGSRPANAAAKRGNADATRGTHSSTGAAEFSPAAYSSAASSPAATSAGDSSAGGSSSTGSSTAGPSTAGPSTAGPSTAGPSALDEEADGAVESDLRSSGQRRADALVDICRLALRTTELPSNGGERPQVNVTIPFDILRQELGLATTETGERLTPAQTRQMACDAQILPVVLNGAGQVLDVGQSRRLFTGALRRALVARDGGCAFPACDRPARWCDGHHIRDWTDGGPTSIENGVLLCFRHHKIVHEGHWSVRLGADKLPEFIPPRHLDSDQRPRRNNYHLHV